MKAIDENSFAEAVLQKIQQRVTEEVLPVAERLKELERQLKAMPVPSDGERGQSAYEIAVSKGFVGDENAWLMSLKGATGERGEKGLDGADGEPGIQGERGEQGPQGEKGERGDAGERGEPGADGADGKDVDLRQVKEFIVEHLTENPPAHGPRGERGEKGERGVDGRDGRDGVAKDGRDGIDGLDGRDALDIEILDGFDPQKTYRKGTFAMQDGGLWRHDGNEWKNIISGIKSFDIELPAERTAVVSYELTDGTKHAKEFRLPALIDRGVWKDSEAYEAGDVVTQDGSMWIAQKDTKSKPGQFNKDWRLSVKRGRNGRS